LLANTLSGGVKLLNRQKILKTLRRQKVMTISEIALFLQCAVISARRKLKEWKALTSCNKNGKFYTLPEITEFNAQGLWRHEDILFSQHGNFKKTIQYLVNTSTGGLSSKEISAITGLNSNNPIFYTLRDDEKLRIEKCDGHAILFSSQIESLQLQRSERSRRKAKNLPCYENAIKILVEMIKSPGIDSKQLVKRLSKQGIKVSEGSIHALWLKHGLSKKNLDTQQ